MYSHVMCYHMSTCTRCGADTANPAPGEYHYCDDCLDRFAEIERHGVVVTQESTHEVRVEVTAADVSFDGGIEETQVDGLARGKYVADETDLPVLFEYEPNGSRWELKRYLQHHPAIREQVHEHLHRLPETVPGT